mgnify:CR=1 FL=1
MPLNTVQMYTQKTNTTLKYQNKPKLIHKTFSLSELKIRIVIKEQI